MKSLELFTGAGGLAIGTHQAGFDHVALLEWNKDACQTLRRNAREGALPGVDRWNVIEGDIRGFDFKQVGAVDMIAGGVPCQPFSLGGKHLGMNDERNMFPDFVRAVDVLRPKAFIVENVKGLLRSTFRNYFQYIVLQLTYPTIPRDEAEDWMDHLRRLEKVHTRGNFPDLKYNVVYRLLNAADFGVPQTRERVFIVGFRSDVGLGWNFPVPTHSFEALLRDQAKGGGYWKRHGVRPPARDASLGASRIPAESLLATKPWRTIRDAIADLPEPVVGQDHRTVANHRLNPGARTYPGHTGSPIDLPSKTLKAGVHGVPGGENIVVLPDGSVRYLTVREAARVQTFPDRWHFEGSWSEAMRQLGNAVPVELAAVVAKSVAERLGETG